jgi:pimeloyl-ACP methyl ester carboxylesterase
MKTETRSPGASPATSCVVALHSSLGSGRDWTKLVSELGDRYQILTTNIAGYDTNTCPLDLPLTLAEEVRFLSDQLDAAVGPIHLIGHSYGGAIAFKIATDSAFAERVRSLTLIEPALPALLRDNDADRRLHDHFVRFAHDVLEDVWNGSTLEAIDKFTRFWNGSGPSEELSTEARLRLFQRADKLAFDFAAQMAEENVAAAAASIRVPTLLISGGLSPYYSQRIVARLASIIINGPRVRHFPTAGHMMPITHASIVNPEIIRHIIHADERCELSLV